MAVHVIALGRSAGGRYLSVTVGAYDLCHVMERFHSKSAGWRHGMACSIIIIPHGSRRVHSPHPTSAMAQMGRLSRSLLAARKHASGPAPRQAAGRGPLLSDSSFVILRQHFVAEQTWNWCVRTLVRSSSVLVLVR